MQFLRTKIVQPLAQMPPFQKVLVVAVGTLGGLVPIPAITSAVTVGLGAVVRLNPQGIAVATAWNLALTPMQFVCFVPFAQLGKVLLSTLLTLVLAYDPLVGDSFFWTQARILNKAVDEMVPSLAAITEANGLGEIIANSSTMLAVGTFAWCLVTLATLSTAHIFLRPLLSKASVAKTQKASASTKSVK